MNSEKKQFLLKLPNFRRLYISGSTSELGSFITETVLMLFLFELTEHSKTFLGILHSSFLFSLTAGTILGGPLGEYFNKKKILIWCEFIRIPIIGILFFFQNIYALIICNSLIAFFSGIFRPSRQALMNEVVPQEKIMTANSLFGSTNAIINLIGPFLGATLFGFFNDIKEILSFDLLTYIVGISLLMKINYAAQKKDNPLEKKQEKKEKRHLFSDIALGLRYVTSRSDLYAIIANQLIIGLCIGLLIPLLVPYIREVLGGTTFQYGITMSLFGLGGIMGSSFTKLLNDKFPHGRIPYITIILDPLLFAGFILFKNYYISSLFFFFWGITVFMRITSQMNFISQSVETHYLSRVHSLLELSFFVPNILGGLIITFFGHLISTENMLYGALILFCLLIYPRLPMAHMKELWSATPHGIKRNIQT